MHSEKGEFLSPIEWKTPTWDFIARIYFIFRISQNNQLAIQKYVQRIKKILQNNQLAIVIIEKKDFVFVS
jgi:hypothetical protein